MGALREKTEFILNNQNNSDFLKQNYGGGGKGENVSFQ